LRKRELARLIRTSYVILKYLQELHHQGAANGIAGDCTQFATNANVMCATFDEKAL